MSENNSKQLVDGDYICNYFSITRKTLFNWRKKGCPYMQTGRIIRYNTNDVLKWINENNESINNEISVEYLIDISEPKGLDLENIGKSLAQKENKWYAVLDKVKTKEIGLELLANLEYAKEHFKNEDYFKYIDTRVRKQEYEVIKALISIVTEDSIHKSEKDDMLYQYIKEKIGFQNLGFKNFPMPIIPEYKNITDENIMDMLEIIGLEKEVNFSNIEI